MFYHVKTMNNCSSFLIQSLFKKVEKLSRQLMFNLTRFGLNIKKQPTSNMNSTFKMDGNQGPRKRGKGAFSISFFEKRG